MRKWIVGFLILGTILWLWAQHETHLPCDVISDNQHGAVWNCAAGTVQFTFKSSTARSLAFVITAPAVVNFRHGVYVLGADRGVAFYRVRYETLTADTKAPFTARLIWMD